MRYLLSFLALCTISAVAQTPAQQARHYLALSHNYEQQQPDSAVYYANEGIQLAELHRDKAVEADLILQLGEINALHHHNELARGFYNEALRAFRQLHDAAGIARSYDALGLLDGDSTDFGHAMNYYRDSRDSNGIITTYTTMGKEAENKQETDKALSFYLRALTQYEHREHKPEAYFSLLETIGRLYGHKGDSAAALRYLRAGIRDSFSQGAPEEMSRLLNIEGEVFEQWRDEKDALSVYKQALAEAGKYHQPYEQAEALLHIAGILKKTDISASLIDLKQSLIIARNLHQPELEARIFAALAGVYRQQKNYGEAMLALESQHRLIDSLLSANTVKDINALENSYALIGSDEKVIHLEEVNRLDRLLLWCSLAVVILIAMLFFLMWRYLNKVKKLNTELAMSNRIKDTLFSVIGHDLKGPAASAAQLFELLEDGEISENEMKEVISDLRRQTNASLDLLRTLFDWGRAQLQGVSVKPVDFGTKTAIDRCIQLLSRQAADKQIHINAQVPENLRVHADLDHFEFVIRNLLANAIKFSFPEGNIDIGAGRENNEVVVAIKDCGVGISKEQQAVFLTTGLKVSFGTKSEKGSGLGLLLTKDFIKANGGRIWLESTEGSGTTFFVAWPAA